MSANTDRIQSMYDAFAAGDVESVVAGMDPEIEWLQAESFPYADGNPYRGPQAVVVGVFSRLAEEWDGWSLAIENLLDAGDNVVALGRYGGTNKASGTAIDAQFVHVWWLRGGKVVRFQQYCDTRQITAAMPGS